MTKRKDPSQLLKTGRKSTYDQTVADTYCERLANGELARDISAEAGMPSIAIVYGWRNTVPFFDQAYARARVTQAQAVAERAVQVAMQATPKNAHAMRVRYDALRWLASKLDPSNYGDKMDVNHTGSITLEALITRSIEAVRPPLIEHEPED